MFNLLKEPTPDNLYLLGCIKNLKDRGRRKDELIEAVNIVFVYF